MTAVPPPVWAALAAGTQALVGRRPTTGSLVAAAPFAIGATGLLATTVRRFVGQRTTVDPHHPDRTSALVMTGPNAWTRNPMYLAMAAALTAHALARRSALALLPVAAFVIVIDRTQIPAEEAALLRRFGRAYRDYRRRVPRWIGLPRP